MHLNIDVGNIPILFFWLMEYVFIIKIIPNLLKMKTILGILLGYFSKSKWYDIDCFEKLKGG